MKSTGEKCIDLSKSFTMTALFKQTEGWVYLQVVVVRQHTRNKTGNCNRSLIQTQQN